MSKPAEKRAHPSNYTREEFKDVLAAIDSILDMDLVDLDATLYNYQQLKKLLLKFNLPWNKGMKKPTMMAALLAHREQTVAASLSTSAPVRTDPADDAIAEETQLIIAAQQVAESDAEEALVDPPPNLDLTKATHGAEMAELDAKLAKIEEETNAMRGELRDDIASVSAASVLQLKRKNLRRV